MTAENPADALRVSVQDPEAFAGFYRSHFAGVLAYLARRVHDPEVALDLTAETFAQAFLIRHRFRGSAPEEAEAWLYRIAKRKLARYFRRNRVEHRALRRLKVEALPQLDAERRARIDDLAELTGLRSALRDALARVSDAQREAVRLRVLEDLSYPEVAERLEISEEAARARVCRALKNLAVALEKEEPTIKEARP